MLESIQIKTIPNRKIETVLKFGLKRSKLKPGNASNSEDSFRRRLFHFRRRPFQSVPRGLASETTHQRLAGDSPDATINRVAGSALKADDDVCRHLDDARVGDDRLAGRSSCGWIIWQRCHGALRCP
jgi:hypothetical protein